MILRFPHAVARGFRFLNTQVPSKPISKFTTLDNGLRIVSEPSFGEYCTIGVGINAGARYESHYPLGVAHFLEKMAFTESKNYKSSDDVFAVVEKEGALIDCQSTKDTFMYASSCHSTHFEEILKIIADTVHRPAFTDNGVAIASEVICFENEATERKPDCEAQLVDWAHSAAYRGNTLGFSKYCNSADVDKIEKRHLFTYMSQYYTPDRIVVAGVGVEHEKLVNAASDLFDPTQTSWAKDPSVLFEQLPPVDHSLAQYTGGEFRKERDLSKMALGPTPYPNLAHLVLGFEGVSVRHDDFVAHCVLQSLMGGGGSFSAGGPGKGMYTRLYSNVMNNHHWVYNATAFNSSYGDSGIFCIRGSAPPEKQLELAKVIMEEFLQLANSDVDSQELQRAKIQLKSQLLMNLEMRPVIFEDLARQVLAHNERRTSVEYTHKIDTIRPVDIRRVAERMLLTKPSVVGYGDLHRMPSFEKFDKATAERSVKELETSGSFFFRNS